MISALVMIHLSWFWVSNSTYYHMYSFSTFYSWFIVYMYRVLQCISFFWNSFIRMKNRKLRSIVMLWVCLNLRLRIHSWLFMYQIRLVTYFWVRLLTPILCQHFVIQTTWWKYMTIHTVFISNKDGQSGRPKWTANVDGQSGWPKWTAKAGGQSGRSVEK